MLPVSHDMAGLLWQGIHGKELWRCLLVGGILHVDEHFYSPARKQARKSKQYVRIHLEAV